jgi:DNA-3-methyladenine glycosylase II
MTRGDARRSPSETGAAIARQLARHDPKLRRTIRRVGALAPLVPRPGFASLAEAIIAQQLSSRAAQTIEGRVRALGGGRIPAPARWPRISDAALRGAGLSRAKIRFLRGLAAHAEDGSLSFARIAKMSDADAVERLTEENGIGRWTAEMYLIFALGRPDVLPVGDYGFRAAVRNEYALPGLPEPPHLERLGEAWRPWRTTATRYLWASLSTPPLAAPAVAAGPPKGAVTVFGEGPAP